MKEVWKIYGINYFGPATVFVEHKECNFQTEMDAVNYAANHNYIKTRNIMILKTWEPVCQPK